MTKVENSYGRSNQIARQVCTSKPTSRLAIFWLGTIATSLSNCEGADLRAHQWIRDLVLYLYIFLLRSTMTNMYNLAWIIDDSDDFDDHM